MPIKGLKLNELIVAPQPNQWLRLKSLVLDSVSSPITKRVYNLGLDEFFAWYSLEPRAGFTKATVSAWRVALEVRGLGAVSINVRITAVRKLAMEAADNGLLAPELANGITRVKGVAQRRNSAARRGRVGADPTVARPRQRSDYGAVSWDEAGSGTCAKRRDQA